MPTNKTQPLPDDQRPNTDVPPSGTDDEKPGGAGKNDEGKREEPSDGMNPLGLAGLEHDPEKWKPLFGKDYAQRTR